MFLSNKYERPKVSVITCFNDRRALEINLLAGVKSQEDVSTELLGFDNTRGICSSVPKALNLVADYASGDIFIFAHQDVFLIGSHWLSSTVAFLQNLHRFGAAGVAGVDAHGSKHGFIIDRGRLWGEPTGHSHLVQTLDEQLLITPSPIFREIRFDDRFKFHSYCADYCLSLSERGYNSYVIPAPVEHNSITIGVLKASHLQTEDQILSMKHKAHARSIRKTTGKVGALADFGSALTKVLYNIIFVMPTTQLSNALMSSKPILMMDAGCLPLEQPMIARIAKKSHRVGVSPNLRYLYASKATAPDSDFVCADFSSLPLRSNSIDVVVVFGVLEYLPKSRSKQVLDNLERIGNEILVKIPRDCSPLDSDHYCFRCCWTDSDLQGRGYRTFLIGPGVRALPHFALAFRRGSPVLSSPGDN